MNFWLRWLMSLVAMAAYLALAVIGWGGMAAFFANPARGALAVVSLGVAFYAFAAGGNVSSGVREDRSNRWVLVVFSVVGLLLGIVPAWTDRIGFWVIDGDACRWIGVALFAFGCWLRIWPVYVLGNRFSGLVAIQPGHTLVTTGIYGVVRHPSYLGLIVSTIGWSLAFRSVAGLILVAFMMVPLVGRMDAEENLLASEFGAEYDAYRSRTSRILPHIY